MPILKSILSILHKQAEIRMELILRQDQAAHPRKLLLKEQNIKN